MFLREFETISYALFWRGDGGGGGGGGGVGGLANRVYNERF